MTVPVLAATFITIAISAGPTQPPASVEPWLRITSSSETAYDGKRNSFVLGKTDQTHDPIGVIMLCEVSLKNQSEIYHRAYVKTADCKREYGKIVFTDLEGQFQYDADFVEDGNNIGSRVANLICRLIRANVQEHAIENEPHTP